MFYSRRREEERGEGGERDNHKLTSPPIIPIHQQRSQHSLTDTRIGHLERLHGIPLTPRTFEYEAGLILADEIQDGSQLVRRRDQRGFDNLELERWFFLTGAGASDRGGLEDVSDSSGRGASWRVEEREYVEGFMLVEEVSCEMCRRGVGETYEAEHGGVSILFFLYIYFSSSVELVGGWWVMTLNVAKIYVTVCVQ